MVQSLSWKRSSCFLSDVYKSGVCATLAIPKLLQPSWMSLSHSWPRSLSPWLLQHNNLGSCTVLVLDINFQHSPRWYWFSSVGTKGHFRPLQWSCREKTLFGMLWDQWNYMQLRYLNPIEPFFHLTPCQPEWGYCACSQLKHSCILVGLMLTSVCSYPLCFSSTFSCNSILTAHREIYLCQIASLVASISHTPLVPALSWRVTSSATVIALLRPGYRVIWCPWHLLLSSAYLPDSDVYVLSFLQLLSILLCLFPGQCFLHGCGKCELLLR